MKEICTLLVKLHIIFSRMQRVNQHARPSIIQVGCPTCCYQVCALDHAKGGTPHLDYHSEPCHHNDTFVFSLRCPSVTPFSLCSHHRIIMKFSGAITVYSRYIAVGGVQAMVPPYKWEPDISGDCHGPKSGSILQRIMSDNGAFGCLAAYPARRQRI